MLASRNLAASLAAALCAVLAGCSATGSSGPTTTPPASTSSPGVAPSSSSTPQYDAVVTLVVSNGKVTGDTPRAKVKFGQTVAVVVTSDVADEIHLHGYDKHVDVTAGGTATLVFVADIRGIFTIELESRSKQLTQLEVD